MSDLTTADPRDAALTPHSDFGWQTCHGCGVKDDQGVVHQPDCPGVCIRENCPLHQAKPRVSTKELEAFVNMTLEEVLSKSPFTIHELLQSHLEDRNALTVAQDWIRTFGVTHIRGYPVCMECQRPADNHEDTCSVPGLLSDSTVQNPAPAKSVRVNDDTISGATKGIVAVIEAMEPIVAAFRKERDSARLNLAASRQRESALRNAAHQIVEGIWNEGIAKLLDEPDTEVDYADLIVDVLLADLQDPLYGNFWSLVDPDVRADMRPTWKALVNSTLVSGS